MIREIQLKDKDQWEKLYRGYADFYKVEINKIFIEEKNEEYQKNKIFDLFQRLSVEGKKYRKF